MSQQNNVKKVSDDKNKETIAKSSNIQPTAEEEPKDINQVSDTEEIEQKDEKNDDNELLNESQSTIPTTPLIYQRQSSIPNVLGSPMIESQKYDIFNPNNYLNGKKLYQYDYNDLHNDLEKQNHAGKYGWDNAAYWAIAEKRAGVDLEKHYTKRHSDEVYLPEFTELLKHPETRKWWPRIVTFDPLGMTATCPTIAATTATLNIPELNDLKRDGVIVDEDGGVRTAKAAVYNVWNLPALALRLNLTVKELRETLHKYSVNDQLLDEKLNAYIPNLGGCTVYTFGDIGKIREATTEIAVRVHDECNGSDVFGTDICTCRPYLIFALRACIECAQRGGVGVVAYFRKEGRSLGEVIKYRVYNSRRHQSGGDRAETYFEQTTKIAGITDARFQTMMPDILNWLGIDRIDWLLSMSREKYDAIIEAGIIVNQRIPLPDSYVPKNAAVEVNAKIAAGYHANKSYKLNATVDALRDLRTIRKQCCRIFKLAKSNKLTYFNLNINNFDIAVKCVLSEINKNYPDHNVPAHSRFRHFDESSIKSLISKWNDKFKISKKEQVRRLIDLITVSVLLDAGAGATWKYIDRNNQIFTRSEGLAAASLDMFLDGLFSSDKLALPTRVNSVGLKELTVNKLSIGFQVSSTNPMVGLNGRCKLLQRLGEALEIESNKKYFGLEIYRPGHLLDYLLSKCDENLNVSIRVLWNAIILGLETIWPKQMSGIRRGDVWVHNKLKKNGVVGSDMVPFHKLQQWLTYSLIESFEYYGINFLHIQDMTCLAEYRNGGLFVDTKVLELKPNVDKNKYYHVGSELVVEWRAMTIVLCDKLAQRVRKILKKNDKEFPLSKVLEGGTWRAGRNLAFKLRKGGTSPINLRSDGTVF